MRHYEIAEDVKAHVFTAAAETFQWVGSNRTMRNVWEASVIRDGLSYLVRVTNFAEVRIVAVSRFDADRGWRTIASRLDVAASAGQAETVVTGLRAELAHPSRDLFGPNM